MIDRESCYLEIAKIKKENELLDAHWEEWVHVNGEISKFEELDDIHLTNIIAMLTRFYKNRQSKHIKALICGLSEELVSRVKVD